MADPRHTLGEKGELLAERCLRRLGMRVLARRYATPAGELDLVMLDGRTLVFVEVKTQTDARLIEPEERVQRAKQHRLAVAAKAFVQRKNLHDRPCRFDVVAIVTPPGAEPQVRHIADAFAPKKWT